MTSGNPRRADSMSIRSMFMLETVSEMMADPTLPLRAAEIVAFSTGDELGRFRLLGANHPDSIQRVHDRDLDIAILNPGVILSMAHKGVGLYSRPMEVALIAVLPHYDQLAFAVNPQTEISSLSQIREQRYPLRLSVRGSRDACTTRLVNQVLRVHGFSYDDILSWGGAVYYDQPMPNEREHGTTRVERVANGEIDAVFEEGVTVWINEAIAAGLTILEIEKSMMPALEKNGFVSGTIEKKNYPNLNRDIKSLDFSGWPIYTRSDADHDMVRRFCEAMEARKDRICWSWGPVPQQPMPIARFVHHAPDTPLGIPFHPAAREVWSRLGYL